MDDELEELYFTFHLFSTELKQENFSKNDQNSSVLLWRTRLLVDVSFSDTRASATQVNRVLKPHRLRPLGS